MVVGGEDNLKLKKKKSIEVVDEKERRGRDVVPDDKVVRVEAGVVEMKRGIEEVQEGAILCIPRIPVPDDVVGVKDGYLSLSLKVKKAKNQKNGKNGKNGRNVLSGGVKRGEGSSAKYTVSEYSNIVRTRIRERRRDLGSWLSECERDKGRGGGLKGVGERGVGERGRGVRGGGEKREGG